MKDYSGPAFPSSIGDERNPGWMGGGMSLRDYFAAKAMAGHLGVSLLDAPFEDMPALARRAYALADAMLVEREKACAT